MANRISKSVGTNGKLSSGGKFREISTTGLDHSSGYIREEFLRVLQGERGRKIYREMADNSPIVGGLLLAIQMLIRKVEWRVDVSLIGEDLGKSDTELEDARKWLDGVLFHDQEDSWDDIIMEVLSCLTYGWAYFETTFKLRLGMHQNSIERRSIYDDGKIGVRRIKIRAQDTLDKWEIDKNGTILGLWQQIPNTSMRVFIPMEKSMLFRPSLYKGNPEGRSILRNAYRPWYFGKKIEEIEAIGVERDLTGLPVVRIPNELLAADDAASQAVVAKYVQLARDIRLNSEGGVVIASDPFINDDGSYTSAPAIDVTLLSTSGTRVINTVDVVNRYDTRIALSVLADFLLLGLSGKGSSGSFALSKEKTNMFIDSVSGWLEMIATPFNKKLIPQLWEFNNFDPHTQPVLTAGRLQPVDLAVLGEYVQKLSGAGMPLFPDSDLNEYLRRVSGLPQSTGESVFEEESEEELVEVEE